MGINRRALIRTTCMVALALAMSPAKSFAASIVGENFIGTLSYVSSGFASAYDVKVGYYTFGSFSYNGAQTGSIVNGIATYNFTGSVGEGTNETTAFKIYQFSNQSGGSLFTDSFTGNGTGNADFYEIQLTYRSVANGGTMMTIMSDTVAKQGDPYKLNGGNPAYILTLTDPTNTYTFGTNDSQKGTYSATNLPLPDQKTLSTYYPVSTAMPGTLSYDQPGFIADITTVYPLGTTIPEPSALVMGIMAIGIGTAGFCACRRKRLRSTSQ